MGDDSSIPKGRLKRIGKLVGLSAKVGTSILTGTAAKVLGASGEKESSHGSIGKRVVETLGELKGAALKAGQTLSMFGEGLPPEVREITSRLFSQAPSLTYPEIAKVITEELGAPPEEVFGSFETTPFAGASFGQVHRARLKSGEEVAVKVQYPGIDEALEHDIKNGDVVVKVLGLGGSLIDAREYFDRIKEQLRGELDYRAEMSRLQRFTKHFSRWPSLKVPAAHPELTTRKVLVLERLSGPTWHELSQKVSTLSESQRFELGQQLVTAVYGPFFLDREIHADTHPGNYLALDDGRLGVLDFGSVSAFSDAFWQAHFDLFEALLAGQKPDLMALMKRAGFTLLMPEEKARPVIEKIGDIVSVPFLGAYDFGNDATIDKLRQLKRQHTFELFKVRPPAEAILFYRALGGLSHNLRSLKVAGDFRPLFQELVSNSLRK